MRGFQPLTGFLTLVAVLACAFPAFAADGPLVLAPPKPKAPAWPGPADLAIDAVVPAATSALLLDLLSGTTDDGAYRYGLLGGALLGPSAALIALRERPPALDGYFAATSGGVLGLLLGAGVSFLLFPAPLQLAAAPGAAAAPLLDTAGLSRMALMAVGQGLGTAAGYVLYEHAKPYLADLNKLPEHRTDDQLNWDRWKERHHNE